MTSSSNYVLSPLLAAVFLVAATFSAVQDVGLRGGVLPNEDVELQVHDVSTSKNDGNLFLQEKVFTGYMKAGLPGGEMFYSYFPSRKNEGAVPLVMWLTGGPGCSSEIAWLQENGPFRVDGNGSTSLIFNKYSWSEKANMVYVDQPLGTGFSLAKDPLNYAHNELQIARDMRIFLFHFLRKFPDLKGRKFFITGESYAGHYIPAIAYHLLLHPVEGLNLHGIAIGNGWVDPATQYPAYADYAKAVGMINEKTYIRAKRGFKVCEKAIAGGVWQIALSICQSLTSRLLGTLNPYDIRQECQLPPLCYNESAVSIFLNREDVQKAMHVSMPWVSCSQVVHTTLLGDWIVNMRQQIADILEKKLQVLIYHGDQDYICNWIGGIQWMHSLQWGKTAEFAEKNVLLLVI